MLSKKSIEQIKPYLPSLLFIIPSFACIFLPMGYREDMAVSHSSELFCVLTYHFAHANVFHFLANSIFLLLWKSQWKTILVGFMCASAAALLLHPFQSFAPTAGLSALFFASYARRSAVTRQGTGSLILMNVITVFIPNVCWSIHILSSLLSFLLWRVVTKFKRKH